METIHTIALCVIINGAVMGVLSSRGGHRRTVRNVKALLLLSVLVVLLTPLVYNGARWAYPGYPFAEQWSELVGRWLPIQYPVLGETTLLELFIKTVLAFAAGQPEPLFPYLALSFLGSAMGLLLYDRRYSNAIPVVGGTIGAALFIVGALGLGVTFITGRADLHGLADHFYELPGLYPALWLWWFLLLSGSFLLTFVLIIRLVEIRGISTQVGKHTLFLRRYGFVAFSVYTFQSIYVLPRLVLDIFPGIRSSSPFPTRMGLVPVMAMVPMTVVIWEVLLRCWQRIDFTFGLEWFLAKASEVLIPSKKVRQNGGPRRAWLRTARLDPVAYLTAPEWSDLKTDEDTSEAQRNDSRLSLVLSSLCIIVPLLLPISIPLALSSFKEDDKNPVNIAALLLGLFSAISWSVILLVLVFAPKVTV